MKLRDFPFSRMTHKSGANENSSANKNDITAFQSSDACGFQNVAETRRQLQVLEELDNDKYWKSWTTIRKRYVQGKNAILAGPRRSFDLLVFCCRIEFLVLIETTHNRDD